MVYQVGNSQVTSRGKLGAGSPNKPPFISAKFSRQNLEFSCQEFGRPEDVKKSILKFAVDSALKKSL